jgi:hypothetical protein
MEENKIAVAFKELLEVGRQPGTNTTATMTMAKVLSIQALLEDETIPVPKNLFEQCDDQELRIALAGMCMVMLMALKES